MNWWGKVLGGTFGWMLGGPLGALLGASLGNMFDNGLARQAGSDTSFRLGDTQRVQTAFFTATFSVMGYIAKADGRVSREEIELAEHVMGQMRLDSTQRRVAQRLFNQGKQAGFPIHEILAQFKRECYRRRNLINMFMEIIAATAFADGSLAAPEQELLRGLAADLGFSNDQFEVLMSRLSGETRFAHGDSGADRLAAAYDLLGVDASVSDAGLKKAYRRLMNQHHPDKLVSKGLPEEMMEVAKEKTQEIKAAYELVQQSRKTS